jgi:hypothetical protein
MTTDQTFPQALNAACQAAERVDPAWYLTFEDTYLPACTPAELHALAAKAPNQYLAGYLAGQALERVALQALLAAHRG